MRVGWEAESSPYSTNFNSKFLKRIRAYDNNGLDFDIKMNFDMLSKSKYISDGDIDTVVISNDQQDLLGNTYDKKVIKY